MKNLLAFEFCIEIAIGSSRSRFHGGTFETRQRNAREIKLDSKERDREILVRIRLSGLHASWDLCKFDNDRYFASDLTCDCLSAIRRSSSLSDLFRDACVSRFIEN
jgi:hypothetical protein